MTKRMIYIVLCLTVFSGIAWGVPSITKWVLKTQTNLLTTELNGLANNSVSVVSPTINNIAGGGGGDGYTMCDIEFFGTFTGNPLANSSITVWIRMAPDGTNFETTPTALVGVGVAPTLTLPVSTGTTVTRINREIVCPPGIWRVVAKNEQTGVALAASGNLLRIRYFTPEGF